MDGSHWAYGAGLIAIVLGAGVVALFFPKHGQEIEQISAYEKED